ncbi:acetyl-coenzyme A transporter 1 [Scaptodrosophila lebanonensis]|uniref:Acetyl-coenzyme A transporter 1 n=1 Tax=Drosophila lebanonensis TaxID=7225 RepID=A0A6J2U9L8_DROLE|nr:acetyl-coenzyme A transporter 1 [Scaptodrosophila lebanonensis]
MEARRRGRSSEDDGRHLMDLKSTHESSHEKPDLRGDRCNIAILLFLYILQGIPIGLIAAIPMLLQNRGASYKQQAEFSFAYWPFSIKLLWAPIVDSLYVRRFGRRKSWLVPVQYLLGAFMLLLSQHVDRWLGGNGLEPNVPLLTLLFFMLNFLAATQDIAVDGWALTMLKRCNVGYASTCNSVGQTAGYFLGYVVFIALESKDFCNTYLRSEHGAEGMVTLPRFLWFWGIVFVVATTLVAIFKRENDIADEHMEARYTEEHNLNIKQSYKILWDMVRMRPVQILAAILLTVKVSFAASDAVTSLKLIDAGVPKEKLALLAIPVIPLQLVLPLAVGRYTNGPRPMIVYLKAIPYRIVLAAVASIIAYATPYLISGGTVPVSYYVLLIVSYGFYQVFLYAMFVAAMAFFAKISDPAVGGTYMTFLNTLCNLGGNWPNTVILWLVDVLTWRQCVSIGNEHAKAIADNLCSNKEEQQECATAGGKCEITFDGYYMEAVGCVVYGIIWLMVVRKWILYLQNLPPRSWLVVKSKRHHR